MPGSSGSSKVGTDSFYDGERGDDFTWVRLVMLPDRWCGTTVKPSPATAIKSNAWRKNTWTAGVI